MPQYRIISELDDSIEHRNSRGTVLARGEKRIVTTAKASNLTDIMLNIDRNDPDYEEHQDRRIISIEEIHPGYSYTDEQLTAMLTGQSTTDEMLRQSYALEHEILEDSDSPCYLSSPGIDFISTVDDVVEALRGFDAVPGLHLSLLQNGEGFVDYTMVEIHDEATGTYRSVGCDIKNLTDDRAASGWDGVLAIARRLIQISNELH